MLSLPHLVVLFVIALVIFGPQKLPELARMLGKATAEFRKMTGDFRYALEEEVREIDRQTRIRDAEAAASASPYTPPPPAVQPAGTMPRDAATDGVPEVAPQDLPLHESVQTETANPPHLDPDSAHSPSEPVSTAHEKSSDDHSAV
jgi:sec-independent protein translocase protein TatB